MARVSPIQCELARVEAPSTRVGLKKIKNKKPRGMTRRDARAAMSLARRRVSPCRMRVRHL